LVLLALASLSCDPRKFDDVADSAWIGVAERDSSQTGGDFGIDVISVPMDGSETGARFVVSAGGTTIPGLAQITYNEKGSKTAQIGGNGESGAKGILAPLDDKGSPTSLVALPTGQFIVGIADPDHALYRFDKNFDNGTPLFGNLPAKSGDATAIGNLGLGDASTLDLVTVGEVTLTLLPDGDPNKTPITCGLKPPNASGSVAVLKQVLTTAKINSGANHDQIILSSRPKDEAAHGSCSSNTDCTTTAGTYCDLNELTKVCHFPSKLLIIEPSAVANGQDCPFTGIDVPRPGPVGIAVGNVDSNPLPDIVAGTILKAGDEDQQVTIYFNLNSSGVPDSKQVLTLSADEKAGASTTRGTRILIANLEDEGMGLNEIVVADPDAVVNEQGSAGLVRIYRVTSTCDAANQRGAACLLYEIFDPDPKNKEYFGRAMTIAQFKTSKATTPILAVGLKDRIWTYFRLSTKTPDPRL